MEYWDERDLELGLRDQMAKLIASIVSGVPDAEPEQEDFDLADAIRELFHKEYEV